MEKTVTDAQERRSKAIKESSAIEAEMNEFKTNKDSKLTEMTV